VTNSVWHSGSAVPGGLVAVTVTAYGHGVRVEVTDRSGDGVPVLQPADGGAEGNRGMRLVDALAVVSPDLISYRVGCGAGSGSQSSAGLARRVRSATEIRTRTALTPIMIQAMRWTPLSVTLVWKTTPVMAEEAMEPT
jgi:hypothetical protein